MCSLHRLQGGAFPPLPAPGAAGIPGLVAVSLPSLPPSPRDFFSGLSPLFCPSQDTVIAPRATLTQGDLLSDPPFIPPTKTLFPDKVRFTRQGENLQISVCRPSVHPLHSAFLSKVKEFIGKQENYFCSLKVAVIDADITGKNPFYPMFPLLVSLTYKTSFHSSELRGMLLS